MNVQNIIPTIDADLGRGESTRSYQYSPHLLYSPHILYPSGYLYGLYPTSSNQLINLISDTELELLKSFATDILPKVDNIDIRP